MMVVQPGDQGSSVPIDHDLVLRGLQRRSDGIDHLAAHADVGVPSVDLDVPDDHPGLVEPSVAGEHGVVVLTKTEQNGNSRMNVTLLQEALAKCLAYLLLGLLTHAT